MRGEEDEGIAALRFRCVIGLTRSFLKGTVCHSPSFFITYFIGVLIQRTKNDYKKIGERCYDPKDPDAYSQYDVCHQVFARAELIWGWKTRRHVLGETTKSKLVGNSEVK